MMRVGGNIYREPWSDTDVGRRGGGEWARNLDSKRRVSKKRLDKKDPQKKGAEEKNEGVACLEGGTSLQKCETAPSHMMKE